MDVGAGGEGLGAGPGEGEIAVGDVAEGPAADGAGGVSEGGGVEFADRGGGVGGEAPADLVGHPVADAGEGGLVEEEGLEGDARAVIEEGAEVAEGEGAVEDLRGEVGPGVGVAVEFEAAELAVVVVGEGAVGGAEEEVVVFFGAVVGGGGVEAAGHAEVKFHLQWNFGYWGFVIGYWGGEGEEEAFAVGAGGGEGGVGEELLEKFGGAVAEDAGFGVGVDGRDDFADGGVPEAAGEFDFGEFGHGLRVIGYLLLGRGGIYGQGRSVFCEPVFPFLAGIRAANIQPV